MKRQLLSAIFIAILLAACVTEPDPRDEGGSVGRQLPQFEAVLNTGDTVSTESLRGRMAVIVFFSTTCADCRRELPEVERAYLMFREDPGVEFVAISRDERPGAVKTFWESNGLTIPYSEQPDRALYNLFATVGVPRVYIADRQGTIVAVIGDSASDVAAQITTVLTQNW